MRDIDMTDFGDIATQNEITTHSSPPPYSELSSRPLDPPPNTAGEMLEVLRSDAVSPESTVPDDKAHVGMTPPAYARDSEPPVAEKEVRFSPSETASTERPEKMGRERDEEEEEADEQESGIVEMKEVDNPSSIFVKGR